MSEKILLIDGHSILNRAFYGLPDLTNSEGKHTGAVYGFLNILFRTIEEEKPQYLTVAFDLKAPTFRHKMFEAYKGTRKPMPEELREQVPLIKEMLTAMGVNVVTKEGYEADDILGTLARKSEAAGMDATILSGDRDLLQLATDKVMIRLPKTVRGKTTIEDYHAQQVIEKYQVTPPQIIELKALMGDSADNIPGIPGVGEKTATKIIVEYGSIENAHEHLEELKPNRARESMREHYDMAQMSKALATICTDSPIEFSYEKAKLGNLYTKEAFLLCRQLEFKNLLNRFDSVAVQEDTLEQEFFTCADLAGCEALFAKAEAGKIAGVSLVTENGRVFGAGLALNEEEIYYIPVEGMITEGYLCGKLEGLLHKVSESNTENIMKSNTDDVKKDPENERSDVNTDGTLKYDKKCVCALDVKALLKHIKSDDPMAVFDAGVHISSFRSSWAVSVSKGFSFAATPRFLPRRALPTVPRSTSSTADASSSFSSKRWNPDLSSSRENQGLDAPEIFVPLPNPFERPNLQLSCSTESGVGSAAVFAPADLSARRHSIQERCEPVPTSFFRSEKSRPRRTRKTPSIYNERLPRPPVRRAAFFFIFFSRRKPNVSRRPLPESFPWKSNASIRFRT